jgi:hypothetical protein
MTLSVSGDSITFPDLSTQLTAPSGFGFKNRIINGDMRIDQRNSGAIVTGNGYPVDRFQTGSSGAQTWTMQRSTTVPTGFTNSVAVTIGTGSSPGASDRLTLSQSIEGYNSADFSFGSTSAQNVTMSFWVRSSLTGAFGVAFRNSATNRSYVASYSVLVANTWEYKSVTIPGDTSGTWAVDNTAGIYVNFDLGCGTTFSTAAGSWQAGNFFGLTGGVKLNATSGATFFLTGVQLEKGPTATAFDYLDYGCSLIQCQRYYQKYSADGGTNGLGLAVMWTTTAAYTSITFHTKMRTNPTGSSSTSNALTCLVVGTAKQATTVVFDARTTDTAEIYIITSGLTVGQAGFMRFTASTDWVAFASEL